SHAYVRYDLALTPYTGHVRPTRARGTTTSMSAARAKTLVNSWETVRYELLNTRICDLGLDIEGSPVEPFIRRLYRELDAKGLKFHPDFYLTDGWGCPDEVPIVGIPFYLA